MRFFMSKNSKTIGSDIKELEKTVRMILKPEEILGKSFLFFILIICLVYGYTAADEQSNNFTLYTLDDILFSSEDVMSRQDAKILAVDFFSIHCEPCKKALFEWEKIYQKYKEKGLRFVVVVLPVEEDRDAELKKIKTFFAQNKYSFPVVFDKYSITGRKFGIVGKDGSAVIPQIFIMNKTGKVSYQNGSHTEIIKKIQQSID